MWTYHNIKKLCNSKSKIFIKPNCIVENQFIKLIRLLENF